MTTPYERISAAKQLVESMTTATLTQRDYDVTEDIKRIIQDSDNPGLDLVDLTGVAIAFLAEALRAIGGEGNPAALRKLQEASLSWDMKLLMSGAATTTHNNTTNGQQATTEGNTNV